MTAPDETSSAHHRSDRLLAWVEDIIYGSIALLLIIAAVVVLVHAAVDLVNNASQSDASALIGTLDDLLLVFIFVELLYAVRTTLKERQIVAEPFLLVGILAAIKEIVVLAVKGANDYVSRGPEFARAMVEIGILGGLVLLLAGSAVLLRKKENEPEENSG